MVDLEPPPHHPADPGSVLGAHLDSLLASSDRPVRLQGVTGLRVRPKRDTTAATRFFAKAIDSHGDPVSVTTDRSPALNRAIGQLLPGASHDTSRYANNRVEADHGRPKARLRPMRGLKRDRTASVIIQGHAFMQNLRRRHYELGVHAYPKLEVAAAFDELARAI